MKNRINIFKAILFTFALLCATAAPKLFAVVPAPDGGYPGFNTAEGQNALFGLDTSTGLANTAVGWFSLKSDVNGSFNTGVGAGTLLFNVGDQTTGDGVENTATGAGALLSNTIGHVNTANGAFALFSNTTGDSNTASGVRALFSNTEGFSNTANGFDALYSNTTGIFNTAIGESALYSNTTGRDNTAIGDIALFDNTEGSQNTAIGAEALSSNTTGISNTANGYLALNDNSTGAFNTANGGEALSNNTEGDFNTATGYQALFNSTTGFANTANGYQALSNNTTGGSNTAIGHRALSDNGTGVTNTAIGSGALFSNTTGGGNTALGSAAGGNLTTGNGNICIGAGIAGLAGETGHTRIGNIAFTNVPGGVNVVVEPGGNLLGILASSRRFKKEIKPMDQTSESILALKPVTFHYKNDQKGIPQFGLIAEEVAEVNPDLVARDKDGEIYTVRYEQINAMLLNEFLKDHRKVEEQARRIEEQEAAIARLTKKMESVVAHPKEQDSGIQKVSAQFELSTPTARFADTIPD